MKNNSKYWENSCFLRLGLLGKTKLMIWEDNMVNAAAKIGNKLNASWNWVLTRNKNLKVWEILKKSLRLIQYKLEKLFPVLLFNMSLCCLIKWGKGNQMKMSKEQQFCTDLVTTLIDEMGKCLMKMWPQTRTRLNIYHIHSSRIQQNVKMLWMKILMIFQHNITKLLQSTKLFR